MAKVSYELTCKAENVKIVDGKAIITFEQEVDIEDINDAEASGEQQSNMLWECFGHSFEGRYEDGVVVTYNDEGNRI